MYRLKVGSTFASFVSILLSYNLSFFFMCNLRHNIDSSEGHSCFTVYWSSVKYRSILIYTHCEGDFHVESQDEDIINVELYYSQTSGIYVALANYSQRQHVQKNINSDTNNSKRIGQLIPHSRVKFSTLLI